jgi:hypothetical protein
MKSEAIKKARARLQRAQEAYDRLLSPEGGVTFETSWTDFLLASHRVYTALEQGAKDNATSRQWFGGKKRERREDPLLQYVHQARNADEHGLDRTYEENSFTLDADFPPGPKPKEVTLRGAEGEIVFRHEIPENSSGLVLTAYRFQLAPVRDSRFNAEFQPPTEHLGAPIVCSPFEVARLTLAYQAALIDEAEQLVGP